MEIPWPKLLSILSSGSVDGAKCELRLLDCVFNDGVSTEGNSSVAQASISEKAENNQLHWYFTTRSGVISKKKADNIKAASIVDRFVKFALANPNNVGKYVGVSIENSSNHRSLYRDWEFAGVVEKYLNSNSASSGDSYLQVYIRPLHGKDVYYTFHATRERRGNYSMYVQTLAEETYQNDPLVNSNAAHAIAYGKKVVEFLHFGCGLLVDNISIEMVVDDNTHVWLSHVPLCVGEQVSRSTAAKEEAEGIRSVSFDLADPAYISSKNSQAMAKLASQKSAQLPQLKPSSSSSSRGLASHASMPALLHADGSRPSTVQSSRPGSVSSHANIGSSAAQASSSSCVCWSCLFAFLRVMSRSIAVRFSFSSSFSSSSSLRLTLAVSVCTVFSSVWMRSRKAAVTLSALLVCVCSWPRLCFCVCAVTCVATASLLSSEL
jgi:hypothetical protein